MNDLNKKIRELNAQYRRTLLEQAMNLTEADRNKMIFDYGMAWINRYFLNNAGIEYAVAKSELFWKWWRNQWDLRDNQFVYETNLESIAKPLYGDYLLIAVNLYHEAHKPSDLKVRPNAHVLKDINNGLIEYQKMETEKLKRLLWEKDQKN